MKIYLVLLGLVMLIFDVTTQYSYPTIQVDCGENVCHCKNQLNMALPPGVSSPECPEQPLCSTGRLCEDSSQCCPGQSCDTNSRSNTTNCCISPSGICTGNDCCAFLSCTSLRGSINPICCNQTNNPCRTNLDCCPGLSCTSNVCTLNPSCQLSGQPCNELFPCCNNSICINNTVCCGLTSSSCSAASDCCQEDMNRVCVEGMCTNVHETQIFNTSGNFSFMVPSSVRGIAVTLCGGGGGGAASLGAQAEGAGGGGAGACFKNLPIIVSDHKVHIQIGRGGEGGEFDSGSQGQDSVLSIPGLNLVLIAFHGAEGQIDSAKGGGGGGDGGPPMNQIGGEAGSLFARGGNGGEAGVDPENSIATPFFESGAGGSAAHHRGGNSLRFRGGEHGSCDGSNQGGGGASALANGGSGTDCDPVGEYGTRGSGGGAGVGRGGNGGDGIAIIQFFI